MTNTSSLAPDAPASDDNVKAVILRHTAETVAAYLGHNALSADGIPALVQAVHTAYTSLIDGPKEPAAPAEPLVPAVSVRKSVTPDYIICLEDGKKLKMLKRHLRTAYGLSPEEYRVKWGLPSDYPMTAPNYAEQRSQLAKNIGLGKTEVSKKPETVKKPRRAKA